MNTHILDDAMFVFGVFVLASGLTQRLTDCGLVFMGLIIIRTTLIGW